MNIEIRVAFSEEVHVTGRPAVVLSVGAETRSAAYASGSGTAALAFRYEVQAGDLDEDGVSVGADALAGGGIADAAGNAAERGFVAVPADAGRKVDGVVPAVTSVAVVSEPVADGTYQAGEEIRIAVEFDGTVLVEGSPVLTLGIGARSRDAALASGSGTARLEFGYEVAEDDYDEDGIEIGGDALTGGAVEDESGNPAGRSFEALGPLAGHRVVADVAAPTVVGVEIVPPGEGDTYLLGENIEIEIAFSEDVHVTGRPAVVLSVGAETRSAAYGSGSGTAALAFRYEVQAGDLDDDGVSVGADALAGGGIADAAGNAADRGFVAVPADAGRKVDGVVPAVTSVAVVSEPVADGTYQAGEEIRIAVEFDGTVLVEGTPVLTLGIGGRSRDAALASGSGTARLEFGYEVAEDDYDEDGIEIGGDALTGGAVEDESGNAAGRSFEALGPLAGHRVVADVAAPTVVGVEIVPPDEGDTYLLGDEIEVRVAFSEEVHVTGRPAVVLSVGAETRSAAYGSGSGTATLAFRYDVQAGDLDDDGVSIAPDALAGGGIADAAGNAADRGFVAVPADAGYKVDGVVPAVTSVAVVSEPGTDETYSPGDAVELAVVFDDAVHVSGSPVLALGIGADTRSAAYSDGSGTVRLLFRYLVQDDDYDVDGISVSANALTGGTIEDARGNPVDRAFGGQIFPGHKVGPEVAFLLDPITLQVGRDETIDLTATLAQADVVYPHGFRVASDNDNVAVVRSAGGLLTITPVSEGTATVTATALRAPVAVSVPVVVEASVAEAAVVQHALTAVGRSLLSSASGMIGARLESGGRASTGSGQRLSPMFGDRLVSTHAPASGAGPARIGITMASATNPAVVHNGRGLPGAFGGGAGGSGFGAARREANFGISPPTSFAIPMNSLANPMQGWGIWGGVDAQFFEGSPEHGAYDGQVTSAYVGADAIGASWVSGAAVSRSRADVSYEFLGDASGAGTLEADLTSFYPYLQVSAGNRAVFWAVLGFGTGEAEARREAGPASDGPSDLSMRLGMAGLRVALGRPGGLEVALRGDGGAVRLGTEEGLRVIDDLGVRAQRVRFGVEASWPVSTGAGEMTPFIDLGGRWDGGDGDTGGGVEVAGGIRYRGPVGGFEVKGRTLAQHGAEGYTESGATATLLIAPQSGGRGLRLSLTPRRGIADSTDRFWRPAYGLRPSHVDRRADRDWTFDGRIAYGFGLRKRSGTVTPFGVVGIAGDRDRTRAGVSYDLDGVSSGLRLRFEFSLQRDERPAGRADHGLLMTLEARF